MSDGWAELRFDGSSLEKGRRGGPGPSASAAVLRLSSGRVLTGAQFELKSGSMEAEYKALLLGLELAVSEAIDHLHIRGDSLGVIDQVLGRAPVGLSNLIALRDRAQVLLSLIPNWTLSWIRREENLEADALARRCLLDRGLYSGSANSSPPVSLATS